jgi:hypothetical protein
MCVRKTWSLKGRGLRAFENKVLWRMFDPQRQEATGGWRKLAYLIRHFMIITLHQILLG